jgi:peroxiredoxin
VTARDGGVAVGEILPDVSLRTGDGAEVRLASLRGRPLLVICLRYYG